MEYDMNDSIGQNKCLGKNCSNHCCSEKFMGLSESLEYTNMLEAGMPLLDEEEYQRILDFSGDKFIEIIDGKPYLKVFEDNCCAAYLDGKCLIYAVRPDACKLYPFYFDQSCGFRKDKNCPGNFTLDDVTSEHYELLKKRISLYEKKLIRRK